jgi:predicted RNA-binding Zn ribbon-like protein
MIEHDGVTYEWDADDMLVPVPDTSATRVMNGRTYTYVVLPPAGASSASVIGNITRSRVTSGRADATLVPADKPRKRKRCWCGLPNTGHYHA